MSNFAEEFYQEAREQVAEFEEALLELEDRPEDEEALNQVFRSLHTIKGGSDMLGLRELVVVAGELETALDRVRSGESVVDDVLLAACLKAKDLLGAFFDSGGWDAESAAGIMESLREPEAGCETDLDEEPAPAPPAADVPATTMRIRFDPGGMEFSSLDLEGLFSALHGLGEAKVVAHADELPGIGELDPGTCSMAFDVVLTAKVREDDVQDLFLLRGLEADLRILDREGALAEDEAGPVHRRLGEILVESGDLDPEDLQRALENRHRLGEDLVESGAVEQSRVEAALAEQQAVNQARKRRGGKGASIRVASEKMDTLVDLVGELVTAQGRLLQISGELHDSRLGAVAEEIERLSSDLREQSLSMRMLPIGTVFNKFRRLVRDLSLELGKDAELVTCGAETELDKNVLEKLDDPLVHLLRNSMDHGMDTVEQRRAAGKPEKGRVRLTARQAGGEVRIEIEDDGRGIDRESVLAKAVQRGLAKAGISYSDEEVFAFLFMPGFSTAEKVSNVSGRGVGMDVVRSSIEALGGSVRISSEKGAGVRVTVSLPLTLAIIEGLEVLVSEEHYVIPLSDVSECVEAPGEYEREVGTLELRGGKIPLVNLAGWFGLNGRDCKEKQAVVVGSEENRAALAVDAVIGQRQTVIKNLGRAYAKAKEFSGATVLGDGSMALILDVASLLELVRAHELRGD
jgi:two-component system chemotaxis sensor kinase CheA